MTPRTGVIHEKGVEMKVNDALRAIAGVFVMLSVALGVLLDQPWFYAFTAFVGVNLLQSAFTRWCPMMSILRALGMEE